MLCVFIHRSQTIELNNSDSGDSPSTISAEKPNVKTKVSNYLIYFAKTNIMFMLI